MDKSDLCPIVLEASLRVSYSILGATQVNGNDFESVAQDVVVDFLESDYTIRDAKTWARRVAFFKSHDVLRKKYSWKKYFQYAIARLSSKSELDDLRALIEESLQSLSYEDEQYIRARFFENATTSEFSLYVGIDRSPGRHRQCLAAAMRNLRQAYLNCEVECA